MLIQRFKYRLIYYHKQKKRGFILALLLIFVLITSLAGSVIGDLSTFLLQEKRHRYQISNKALAESAHLLLTQALIRAQTPIDIEQNIRPRILMFPCPDNVGDKNLDGAQDPTCGAHSGVISNKSNGILNSGSRFGRLPWRSRLTIAIDNAQFQDGIDKDSRDGWNNRLWYAVAKNVVPAYQEKNYPLNFHRLMTLKEGWLSLVNAQGRTVSRKSVAVLLAPNQIKQAYLNENVILTEVFDHRTDVHPQNGRLTPTKYFEAVTLGNNQNSANYDYDGNFLTMSPTADFNDSVYSIELSDLFRKKSAFFHSYQKQMGINSVHNAPLVNSPLSKVKQALSDYYTLFDFFPTPASQHNPDHLNNRTANCGRFHTGVVAITTELISGTQLQTVVPLTLSYDGSGSSGFVTVSISKQDFLLGQQYPMTVISQIIYNDEVKTVTDITLAPYGRLQISVDNLILASTVGMVNPLQKKIIIPVNTALQLYSPAIATVPANTPLHPATDLIGWLGEKESVEKRAANDGEKFRMNADTPGLFLSDMVLTINGIAQTINAADPIKFLAGGTLVFEENYNQLPVLPPFLLTRNSQTLTVRGALPLESNYNKRQLAVWLQSDLRNNNKTVKAPAVLYPWRAKTNTKADSRDNLENYPTCFNSRNYFDRNFAPFIEDQTIVYAVSESCHYGSAGVNCGQNTGFTVSVAQDVMIALPQSFKLTHTFTATIENQVIEVTNGVLENAVHITLDRDALMAVKEDNETWLEILLTANTVMSAGVTIVLQKGTTVKAGSHTQFVDVPALLAYSPAPQKRVPCTIDMPDINYYAAVTMSLANQTAESDDITALCYWLDNEENADGDGVFVINTNQQQRPISSSNDYFILLGGRLQ